MKEKMGAYAKVPLTDDEKDLLLLIYDKRRRLLLVVYLVLMTLVLGYSFRTLDMRSRYSREIQYWEENEDAKYVSRGWMVLVNLCLVGGMVMSTGIFFYIKNVRPFKKDADSGLKDKVPYTVIRKEYFEFTNQYYIALDDPNYLHHEVDQEMYYNIREDECIYLYRATRSKHVFERNGRFTIL